MKAVNKILTTILTLAMLTSAVSCGGGPASGASIEKDREGNFIKLPKSIDKIISMGPSNTEILVALGCGDKIIATDSYSDNIEGIAPGISVFDMMAPDGEQILNMQPDVVFVTGMSKADGSGDLLKSVADAGVCVIYMPSSSSLEAIMDDIRYIAAVMNAEEEGEAIISDMEKAVAVVKEIGEAITEKKKVYFEIEAPPYMCSFGDGVFLNELIGLIGAENIFSGHESWILPTDEAILYADPDVILTSVNYIADPVGGIKARPGWNMITAVKNDAVYRIDTDASNRPSHHVVKALEEMAKAIYPDKYIK